MSDRLNAAQAALQADRRDEAIEHLIAAVTEDPARAVQVYRILVVQLYRAGRFEEGETYAAMGVERHPRDFELMNTRGVVLRRLRRLTEAAAVLEKAIRLNPKSPAAQTNLGNVLLDAAEYAKAEAIFAKLVRVEPRNSDYHRQLGRALGKQGKTEPALVRLRQAVTVKRDNVEAWLDIAGTLSEALRNAEAEEVVDKAIAANPESDRLLEAKAIMMRRLGQHARAEEFLAGLRTRRPNAAWIPHQLGLAIADRDRARANTFLEEACRLDPRNLEYAVFYAESLERTRTGDEGDNIERAYQFARKLMPRKGEFSEGANKIMSEIFARVCDFDALEEIGDFTTLGRAWARSGRHAALFKQLARVRTFEDRLELVEQHRMWGRSVEASAAKLSLPRPQPRAATDKIRVGFMSSDLRQHPVGYFTLPLFDHFDRNRFEVFAYSFYQGAEDAAQKHMASRITGYRWWPNVGVEEAAGRIAADQLDILIELGGSTHMNKLEVMAYRPAPVQASWLGYPHSAGLAAIDYFVCDPFIAPEDPRLLMEKPLMLKHAWYPLSRSFFRDEPAADPVPPVARNGYVTFGTANQPHKHGREVLRAWARILASCPGSRFLFIRPEGSSESFRENIRRAFALEGVSGDRIEFQAVRGVHLPHYNRIDISLDTFPQTGGTTTCESLWMGAPCVSLVGPAPYERLSYSVLQNVGLPELATRSVEQYIEVAVQLASDPARIAELRAGMRTRMRNSPLGQDQAWAADFYEAVETAVRSRSPAPQAAQAG
ncbi:tetratricopeptide repeat protein [Phenylobacterium sp.]|uniref:tetratricopeptide repeat protein n=1 Tax=Phenylobacterium sp. TaxID=1871053 RepID=UPI002EDA7939